MWHVLESIATWAITGLLGYLTGLIVSRWRTSRRRDREMLLGLRELLLCKLEQLQDGVMSAGMADNDLKTRAQRIYDCYHALGGNGHGTQVNKSIQDSPTSVGRHADASTSSDVEEETIKEAA